MPRIKGQLSPEARERQIARQRANWLYQWNAREFLAKKNYHGRPGNRGSTLDASLRK